MTSTIADAENLSSVEEAIILPVVVPVIDDVDVGKIVVGADVDVFSELLGFSPSVSAVIVVEPKVDMTVCIVVDGCSVDDCSVVSISSQPP